MNQFVIWARRWDDHESLDILVSAESKEEAEQGFNDKFRSQFQVKAIWTYEEYQKNGAEELKIAGWLKGIYA